MRLCSKLIGHVRKILLSNFCYSDTERSFLALKRLIREIRWIDCLDDLYITRSQSSQTIIEIRNIPANLNDSSLRLCQFGEIFSFNGRCEIHKNHVTGLRDCAFDNLKL